MCSPPSDLSGRRGLFHAPLALTEMFEQFETMCVAERLGDLSETGEYALLWTGA